MSLRHKSLLVIPPKGGRIRILRIRFPVAALVLLVVIAGITGFFIPFSGFSPDVVEQNQRKNLKAQNRKLSSRIQTMRRMFHELDARLSRIKERKKTFESHADISDPRDTIRVRRIAVDIKGIDRLVEYVSGTEELYLWFADAAGNKRAVLGRLPVLPPVAGHYAVTAGFGMMTDPFTSVDKFHYGIDLAAKRETPVVAAADGIVVMSENHSRWGRRVRISHAYGFSTVYAHLGTVLAGQGRRVKRGETIGTVGISGTTTGPHLHYEIWKANKPVDPVKYMFPAEGLSPAKKAEGAS
jgi:murein DD-endopeptidase MepM/ murein hydrolase activator NlpD